MSGDGLARSTVLEIVSGGHANPFGVLGPCDLAGGLGVRAFVPGAETLSVIDIAPKVSP